MSFSDESGLVIIIIIFFVNIFVFVVVVRLVWMVSAGKVRIIV